MSIRGAHCLSIAVVRLTIEVSPSSVPPPRPSSVPAIRMFRSSSQGSTKPGTLRSATVQPSFGLPGSGQFTRSGMHTRTEGAPVRSPRRPTARPHPVSVEMANHTRGCRVLSGLHLRLSGIALNGRGGFARHRKPTSPRRVHFRRTKSLRPFPVRSPYRQGPSRSCVPKLQN